MRRFWLILAAVVRFGLTVAGIAQVRGVNLLALGLGIVGAGRDYRNIAEV